MELNTHVLKSRIVLKMMKVVHALIAAGLYACVSLKRASEFKHGIYQSIVSAYFKMEDHVLMMEWSKTMEKSSCNSGSTSTSRGVKSVELRKLIYNRCRELIQVQDKVFLTELSLMAASIVETFTDKHISQMAKAVQVAIIGKDDFSPSWNRLKRRLMSQLELRVMSSIQLASKMLLKTGFTGSIIQDDLNYRNKDYSLKAVFCSELRVLRTNDFRVPLFTSVDIASHIIETVCGDFGMNKELLHNLTKKILALIFVSDARIPKLNHSCQLQSCNLWSRMVACASVVIGCRILKDYETRLITKITSSVAKCVECDRNDVTLISDHFMTVVVGDTDSDL